MTEEQRITIRRTIDENRIAGGSSWRDFTKKELEEIYGHIPYWAEKYDL